MSNFTLIQRKLFGLTLFEVAYVIIFLVKNVDDLFSSHFQAVVSEKVFKILKTFKFSVCFYLYKVH